MSYYESNEETKYNKIKNVISFTTFIKKNSNLEFPSDNEDISDDDLYDDALDETYKTFYIKWTEESQVIEK